MRLSRILNDQEPMTARNLDNWVHLCHKPMQVHRQDSFSTGRHGRLDGTCIHRPSLRINVNKNRLCPTVKNRSRSRYERHGDSNDLVARTNSSSKQRQVQGRRSAIERNTMLDLAISPKTFLK